MTSEEKGGVAGALPEIFSCTQCGECCRGFGGTVVSADDIRKIARYIDESPDEFPGRYCQMSGSKQVLAQGADGRCIFWNGLCGIHPVKPRMCRAWPYLPHVLVDVDNWRIMAASCPGMRTDIPDTVIRQCVQRHLKTES